MQVQLARLEQGCHLVPRLVHLAAVDALDGCALEDDVVGEVERNWFRGNAEQGNSSAAAQNVEAGANGAGVTSHFENNIDADAFRRVEDGLLYVLRCRVEYEVGL